MTMAKKKNSPQEQEPVAKIEEGLLDFHVVGIGASAGGLEALQEFFKSIPDKPEASFIVVQHLSPDYKSFMDELLSRYTKLPINIVEEGTEVERNRIYLIPPRMNMTISHGHLHLVPQPKGDGLNLPIDIFLRSLALDQKNNAISIILSGTGSDGALGVRAIKEYGGMTMVQDELSAKFDGMPRSATATGLVDFILAPEQLATELIAFIKHPFLKKSRDVKGLLENEQSELNKIIAIIHDIEGVDFSAYKHNTIIRRLEKRISINRIDNIEDYVGFLAKNKAEIKILSNELLIGVTKFFRDENLFDKLKTLGIPKLFESQNTSSELRVWVPACSTGEEAFSIAILLSEYMSDNKDIRPVKIFATDLDARSLEFASTGFYPDNIAYDVNPSRLARYFIKRDGGYQVNEELRSMIIFARHDILKDPPFTKMNLISCRNLLIYLNNETQQNILSMFYNSLVTDGLLFLGSSESLGNMSKGYSVIDGKAKLYKKNKGVIPDVNYRFGTTSIYRNTSELRSLGIRPHFLKQQRTSLENMFDEILEDFLPPTVIIDEEYNVVHSINNVNVYLKIPKGHASLNLLKMLDKEIAVTVSSLIRRSEKKDHSVIIDKVIKDKKAVVSISCKMIKDPKTGSIYFMLFFTDEKKVEKGDRTKTIEKIDDNFKYIERIEELERDLQYKSESLQATVEELETSNEELQSSNEELIASNEELQSTNEELQSVNEELHTVNSEHIRKIDELTELNADFDNLLKNTLVGTIYLDSKLLIRRINEVASRITNILNSDIGRPIDHLRLSGLYDDFLKDVVEVNETLVKVEKEIIINEDSSYLMKILPYRTADNAVDGIIVTFVDISKLKKSQSEFDDISEKFVMAMEVGEMSWWHWDMASNKVITGNGKYEMLGYKKDDIGDGFEGWTDIVHPEDYEKCMGAMKDYLQGKANAYFIEYRIKHKEGHYLYYRDKGSVTKWDKEGKPIEMIGIVMNITDEINTRIGLEKQISHAESLHVDKKMMYEVMFNSMSEGVVFQNADGSIIDVNPTAEKILGLTMNEMTKRTSENPEWQPIKKDGSPYPGAKHPSMMSLRTGKKYHNKIMGVFNPKKKRHIFISIDSIPVFKENEKKPYMVYTLFHEISN